MNERVRIKKKSKNKTIWTVVVLLLIVIISALGYFYFHGFNVLIKQKQLHSTYKASTELLPEDTQIPQEVFIEKWKLARIIIPRIDVDLIVLGGVDVFDKENLDKGPLHFGESLDEVPDYRGSLPNTESGNVAIAGHRPKRWGFFYDIDLLEKGDEIILDVEGYRFIYRVKWQRITDKHDWSYLEVTDYPALTLMACEPKDHEGPDAPYRLFLRSELIKVTRTPELD